MRDVKLAVNVQEHPEISLQMGLYRIAATHTLGYVPDLELVTGDGQVQLFQAADKHQVLEEINNMINLRNLPEAPRLNRLDGLNASHVFLGVPVGTLPWKLGILLL